MKRLACIVTILAASLPAAASPIIGGTPDDGDPAVVMLAAYPSDMSTLFTCTAVVIAPKVLLTAAHCVDHDGYTFGVFYGSDGTGSLADLEPNLEAVTAVHKDPSYSTSSPFVGDVAIVDLAAAAPATPLAYARTAPTAADVGTTVKIVGYGETVDGTNASKKTQALTVIAALDAGADTVTVGDGSNHTCVGDSGGPAITSSGVVIGVDSYTDTSGCTGPSHFRRTDAYLAFIDAAIAGSGSSAGSGSNSGSGSDGGGDSGGGGCDAGSSGGAGAGGSVLAAAALLIRRRRRRA